MRRWRPVRSRRRLRGGLVIAGAAALLALSAVGGAGCTLLLDTSGNPQKCGNDADCARFPDAVCDSARKLCVPRLPYGTDAGSPDTGAGGAPACELAFDTASRINAPGPDGGLRPLPEAGP